MNAITFLGIIFLLLIFIEYCTKFTI